MYEGHLSCDYWRLCDFIFLPVSGRVNIIGGVAMQEKEFYKTEYYKNRELSWMQFDERVLEEAWDKERPLFDRLKFLGISASNLDEFFMVRIASLKDMIHAGYKKKDIAGLTVTEQIAELNPVVHRFVEKQYDTYNNLSVLLEKNGLVILGSAKELNDEQAEFVDRYFMDEVYPVLTPMAVDSSRPFPLVRNKTLNIGALLYSKHEAEPEPDFAMVQVPDVLSRVVELPGVVCENGEVKRYVIFLEEIIKRNIEKLFLNYNVICAYPFRIMRNADLEIDEDEAEDLLKEIEKQLKKRQWGASIRLDVQKGIDERLLNHLSSELFIRNEDIYEIEGPLDLTVVSKIMKIKGFEDFEAPGYVPRQPDMFEPGINIFEQIREKDRLLMLPYEIFDPVLSFIQTAAKDPDTLAIKMTLYRVSGNSPIISALMQAAENGKQVSVLVELKARFDEENNIVWARKLEKAGCHVIYGLVGLKTHSKISLVVRRENDGIRRYVHLGTGNYNDVTARLYTDMGLFTAKKSVGEDATAVFNMLSGYSEPEIWNKLSLAPLWLKGRLIELIEREAENAAQGKTGKIIAKMNSVCDPDVIAALYKASACGVNIELIVRGICCLKTGIPGISETITVRSIVGDFLEHSRIFIFENGGNEEIYMASADWMPRNLERRVEIMFPVEDKDIIAKLKEYIQTQLSDTMKARLLLSDGTYKKICELRPDSERINSQEICCKRAAENAEKYEHGSIERRVFIPEKSGKWQD